VGYATDLVCRECRARYPLEPRYVCERCFGPLEVSYDYEAIREQLRPEHIAMRPPSMYRYRELLPLEDDEEPVDLGVGYTPLLRASRLGQLLGLENLYLKCDTTNPTHSFKDRVVSVAVTKAKAFRFDAVACASTGNLANAVAAHAARSGMKAFIFVPAGLERAKVLTTGIYRPVVVEVEGTYDDVNRLCAELAEEYHWAFVNVNLRPYYSEGAKTLAYEVAEQLGWRAPDHVIVPVASGNLLVKIHKGFEELTGLGFIPPHRLRIHGAQPGGCAPVAQAFAAHADTVMPVRPSTIAKSLAIGNPADGVYVLSIVRKTGGIVEVAGEEEIVEGIRLLAETEGIFTETAGGVTVAVLRRLASQKVIDPQEVVVAYITGMGLKTLEAVEDVVEAPVRIPPSVRAFEESVLPRVPGNLAGVPGNR